MGRADQYAQAYRRWQPEIRRWLFARLRCRQTAEDLCQETFIRLVRVRDLDEVGDMRAYLYRVAANLLIDHVRATKAKSQPTELVDVDAQHDLACDRPSSEQVVVYRDKVRRLGRVVDGLSSDCRRIFWLSRAGGYCNYEIADRMGVCLSTVEKNINRATRRCREELGQDFAWA